MKDRKRWDGLTVACIASGPSLTAEDCESIRTAGLPAIVTNNTWQLAPWADVLYAGDYQWWKRYGEECTFAGSRWTYSERASREFDLHWHRAPGGYNTGMRAMQLARDLGASRILMLGYDTDVANGTHWHGQHQAGKDAKGKRIFIGNPDSDICRNWHRLFRQLAAELKGIEIVNCSRATALTCFTRQSLDQALA